MLVTGGTGGPVPYVARWLAERGAEHVVLLDPADAPATRELAAELEEDGTALTVTPDREALAETGVRIQTIVHTSVAGELAPLLELTPERLADVVAANLAGAGDLDELCGMKPDDTVVYFSSIAAAWGSRDHGAYAAANACLDALAQRRRAAGRRAVSVAWGLWDLADGTDEQNELIRLHADRSRKQGLAPLDPRLALTALNRILDHDDPNTVVADIAWDRFASLFTMARRTRLFDGVPAAGTGHQRRAGTRRRRGRRDLLRAAAGDGGAPRTRPARRGPRPGPYARGRRAAVRRGGRAGAGAGVQGPGLRLHPRGRPEEPPARRHRAAPARHARLRLPDTERPGGSPAERDPPGGLRGGEPDEMFALIDREWGT